MQLIEISDLVYIALPHIVKVIVSPYEERSKPQDVGFGMKSKSRKIGEKFTLTITTSDGVEHRLDEEHSTEAYRILFPE